VPSNSNQVRRKISAALCLLPQNSSRSTNLPILAEPVFRVLISHETLLSGTSM
jgi:hypothetical protein